MTLHRRWGDVIFTSCARWEYMPNHPAVIRHINRIMYNGLVEILGPECPFCWFRKGSCQFLAKECAQYAQEKCGEVNRPPRMILVVLTGPFIAKQTKDQFGKKLWCPNNVNMVWWVPKISYTSFWQNGICKQCRPRSCSLIRVYTVCHSINNFKKTA